jgi:molybdopterin molybdotransferase
MITVDEALQLVLGLVQTLPTEVVPLAASSGRVMALPATARRDQPPFEASAMDGYALIGPLLSGQSFDIVGESSAGHGWTGHLKPGNAVRIFTGAPVPAGADHVVIQEDVNLLGTRITLGAKLEQNRNIRAQGQDFRIGDTLGPRQLRPTDLALLAAMNVADVTVIRRPEVAIIATGDELVMPGEAPRGDQIIASNSFALAAMVQASGGIARMLPIARDTEASLRTVLDLAAGADLVVTIGGASVGDHDLVGKVATSMGLERAFYKIAMRPGKPLMAGHLRGSAMLGLPGNPVSSIVCGHIFMLPMLRKMQGLQASLPQPLRAILAEPLGSNGPRTHYMRARLIAGPGLPRITAFDRQDSALLGVLSQADALLIRPVGDGPQPTGTEVAYLPI